MRHLTSKEQGELDFWIDHIIGRGCFRESGKGYLEQWSEGARSRLQYYFSVIQEPILTENVVWIDVGCGPYSVLLQAPEAVTKIMIDPLMKHYFHHKLVPPGTYGSRHIFLEGFAEDLALANESADIVFCTNALDHVDNPWVALSELARILKVGGYLILEVDTGGDTDDLHPHAFSVEELEARIAYLRMKHILGQGAQLEKRRPGAQLYYGFYKKSVETAKHFPLAELPKRGTLKPLLVAEGICEFNIILQPDPRAGDVYYGIRQSDGPYYYEKIVKGAYPIFFEGASIGEVKRQIEDFVQGAP